MRCYARRGVSHSYAENASEALHLGTYVGAVCTSQASFTHHNTTAAKSALARCVIDTEHTSSAPSVVLPRLQEEVARLSRNHLKNPSPRSEMRAPRTPPYASRPTERRVRHIWRDSALPLFRVSLSRPRGRTRAAKIPKISRGFSTSGTRRKRIARCQEAASSPNARPASSPQLSQRRPGLLTTCSMHHRAP